MASQKFDHPETGRWPILGTVLALGACGTSSYVLTGTARAPIAPVEVRVYSQPPPVYESIAILDASSHTMYGSGGQQSTDKVIARLKEQAAHLGANGVVLEAINDSPSEPGDASASSGGRSRPGAGVRLGASLAMHTKKGHAGAIFVPPGS